MGCRPAGPASSLGALRGGSLKPDLSFARCRFSSPQHSPLLEGQQRHMEGASGIMDKQLLPSSYGHLPRVPDIFLTLSPDSSQQTTRTVMTVSSFTPRGACP